MVAVAAGQRASGTSEEDDDGKFDEPAEAKDAAVAAVRTTEAEAVAEAAPEDKGAVDLALTAAAVAATTIGTDTAMPVLDSAAMCAAS